ncbi:PREDICTED: suppressor of cytokine signaling 4 [Crocodylus porosus]|uniref:Suppressor of cytokine signaling 4 n=1 Tax=Crocodylus porosus TaxID=8502 RepID=A0A7M4G378_CROPO|nr:PREDICTED: suppressor of cytokine signaling 4 [Crocodylus porosus]XP_019406518.1 PREDICTED: suppressor of cytokine signaling 4 [Crocodylus porosus]XP_019406519.1 PREDICTED: suppressor of cytokine signaling 4 [Crocodylus porosus]XP_019406520.1 PREDICTED: suppressor of cytokine signaling 4 [Crocodylus porosus]
MAENKESNSKNVDVRPKTSRSRSADRKDGYVWSGKKLSWSRKSEHCSEAETVSSLGKPAAGLRNQERKHSCSSGELELDRSCGHRFLGRSFKQKLQDAVGQCFPLKNCGSRHSSMLPSKRKIHISELMLDKCPFPPRSELASRWHLIKRHTAPISQKPEDWMVADLSQSEERDNQPRDGESFSGGVSSLQSCDILDDDSCNCDPRAESGVSQVLKNEKDESDMDSDDEVITLCTSSRKRNKPKWETDDELLQLEKPPKYHTQIDYVHCLVPDLLQINNNPCYWGVMDKYAAEALLEGKPEGTFLLRDSAQEDYLFSVSFRRYSRSLHARIEQWNHNFSFDAHDPCVFHSPDITGLLEHYKDPSSCMFFEPLLSTPLHRTFPFSLQHICRTVICNCTTYDGIDALPVPPSVKLYLKEYHYKSKVRVLRIDVPEQQS